jgi:hypothetical protein
MSAPGASVAFIAGYRPFQFTDFSGGLNLRDKADAVGDKEAIDLLNVTFTERGAIRQRDGYVDFTLADLTNRVDSLSPFYTVAGTRQLVAGAGTRLDVVDAVGNPAGAATGLTGGPYTFARFGDPTHEWLFAANGKDTLRRWDGAAWDTGAASAVVNAPVGSAPNGAMPKAGAVCVLPSTPGSTSGTNASNRLIATAFGTQATAGPGGAATTPSRVYFSNAGQPMVWEWDGDPGDVATQRPPRGRNYKDLTPGDGEAILAAVAWRELAFIFKETKFFIFWGEGEGDDGTPAFQVREVANAIGLASPQAVAVGRDGVYFMNRRGVYRSSGGDPVLLSDVISPMWTQDPDVYFQSEAINLSALAQARALWHEERLYLAVPTGSSPANDRVLVYDTQHEWWSLYDWPVSALTSFRFGEREDLHFGYATGPQRIGRQGVGVATDRGLPIASRWRSGWSDYGSSQQRTLRETKVWGSGAVSVGFATDFNRTLRGDIDVRFGLTLNWPAIGTWDDWIALGNGVWPGGGQVSSAQVRYATRGTVFSTQFSNSPFAATWSVHRVARHLREVREASIR